MDKIQQFFSVGVGKTELGFKVWFWRLIRFWWFLYTQWWSKIQGWGIESDRMGMMMIWTNLRTKTKESTSIGRMSDFRTKTHNRIDYFIKSCKYNEKMKTRWWWYQQDDKQNKLQS